MDIMNIMGIDEHEKLFESGLSNRESTSVYQIGNDIKEGQDISVSKKTGWTSSKGGVDQGVRASSNFFHKSIGNTSNGNREPSQIASRIGISKISDVNLGNTVSEEELPQELGMKEKVCYFDSTSETKFFSVFLGNLPPFANNRWIFDNFSKLGKVADYYVSGRLSKFSKKHFGFVRFHSLEDANKAVEQFNGAWVDGFKLEVDLAKFPRPMLKVEGKRNYQIGREEQQSVIKGTKDGLGFVESHKAWCNPNKTFAQVLVGRTDVKMTDVDMSSKTRVKAKAEVNECDWLNFSIVAKIKWGASIRNIRKELITNVKGLQSVSRLGIRKLILSFNSLEDRNHAIISGDWKGLLEDVREWRGELVCTDKLWNISCIGIPISAWNVQSFRSIAELWGSMVYINDVTLKGEDFTVANFMIETKAEITNTFIDLLVGNEVFQVKVIGVMLESLDEKEDENGKLLCSKEGDISVLDLDPKTKPKFRDANVNANRHAINLDNSADVDQNIERNVELSVIARRDAEMLVTFGCQDQLVSDAKEVSAEVNAETMPDRSEGDQISKCHKICVAAERSFVALEPNSASNQNTKSPATCVTTELNKAGLEPRFFLQNQNLVPFNGYLSLEVNEVAESKQVGDQVSSLDSEPDFLTADLSNLIRDEQSAYIGLIPELDVNIVLNPEADNIADKRKNLICTDKEAQDPNSVLGRGSMSKVEKEVEAMMNLGNSLDIFNASFFEKEVRQATLEDIEEEYSSIGVRVRSKRKSAGKSKVQCGCRLKKKS